MTRVHPVATVRHTAFTVALHDAAHTGSDDLPDDLDHAVADAMVSGLNFGVAGDVVVLFIPQESGRSPFRVVEHATEPALHLGEREQCAEFDLRLPTGRLVPLTTLHPGQYRARWSWADAEEHRLDVWPSKGRRPPLAHRISAALGP